MQLDLKQSKVALPCAVWRAVVNWPDWGIAPRFSVRTVCIFAKNRILTSGHETRVAGRVLNFYAFQSIFEGTKAENVQTLFSGKTNSEPNFIFWENKFWTFSFLKSSHHRWMSWMWPVQGNGLIIQTLIQVLEAQFLLKRIVLSDSHIIFKTVSWKKFFSWGSYLPFRKYTTNWTSAWCHTWQLSDSFSLRPNLWFALWPLESPSVSSSLVLTPALRKAAVSTWQHKHRTWPL
jgi:hypothetical protein